MGRAAYTSLVVGTYTVVATASDATGNQGSTSATFQAIDAAQDIEPPVVALTTPAADATITAPTTIRGTVQDVTLVGWALAYSLRGEERFTTLATGTTEVTDGVLGTLDPILLLNDLYDLRLTAEDANGRTTSTTVVVRITGGMKVGHLSFTIQDLTIPVVGLPITINRTYDSRDTTLGDFGVGWRLDVQTLRLRKNRVLGTGWQQGKVNTFTYCVEPQGAHYVTLAWPDGRTEAFDVTLEPACQTLFPMQETTTTFTARPGTVSQLEAVTDNTVLVVGALDPRVGNFAPVELVHFDAQGDLEHYDPVGYRLTTPEGMVWDVDQSFGVQRMTEPNGNTLTFGPGGILHSAGPGVVCTRDAKGRITQITDPNSHTLTYTYDAAGALVAVTDQEEHVTRYTYDATHKLLAIEAPRGVVVARNLYDNDGRLVAHIDAEGHRLDYTHNLNTRQEVITDRLGHATVYEYDATGNVVRTTDPLGGITAHTYDGQGNVLTETNALNQTRTYTYDAQNNRLTETNPLGYTTTYTYNSRRQVLTVTDPLGRVTTNAYHANGNRTSTTDRLGNITRYTYNARGLQTSHTDPLESTTTYAYNSAGSLTTETDALGHTTTYTYDSNGNRLSQTTTRMTSSGVETLTTTYTYDRLNRLVQTMYPDGSTTRVLYNSIGTQSATFDQLGRQTTYYYDELDY